MYAGIWKRLFAFLIDAAVFVILFWALTQMAGLTTASVAMVVIIWLYYALLESSPMQASLGKIIMGLKVVDRRGRRLSFWQATERILSKLVTNITFYFGFFVAAFDRKKQTLHDRISHSTVILKNTEFDPDDFVEAEDNSLTLVTIVSILLALVFVSALLMTVALPQYRQMANEVETSVIAEALGRAETLQLKRVREENLDPNVWQGEFAECTQLTPRILKCPGFEMMLMPAGITAAVRTPAGDLLYTLFKPYDGSPVVCTAALPEGENICSQIN